MLDIFDPYYLEKRRAEQQAAAAALDANGGMGPEFGSKTPEERQSWLDAAYEGSLGGLDYMGKILDKTFGGRAVRGLLGGRPEELLSIIPGSDSLGITKPENIVHGKTLLDQAGFTTPGDDGFLNTVAGLGAEILLDPSTYMTFGAKTALGKTLELAGKQTKGLASGIRAGERGLVGFSPIPFGSPIEALTFGTGETGARVAEGIPKYAGKLAYAPVQAGEFIAKPVEWATGINPVTKAYDTGAWAAEGLGRAFKTHFNTPTANAVTREGQAFAEGTYTPAVKDALSPYNKTLATAVEELNPIMLDPVKGRALMEGMRLQGELGHLLDPMGAAVREKQIRDTFQETLAKAGETLNDSERLHTEPWMAYDKIVGDATLTRDDELARLGQSERYLSQRNPDSIFAGGTLSPAEIDLARKHTTAFQNLTDADLARQKALGLTGTYLEDPAIDYMTRQLASLPQRTGEGMWAALGRKNAEGSLDYYQNTQRIEPFAGIPGGTDQIQRLMKDPALVALPKDQLAQQLRAFITGTVDPPVGSRAWKQSEELADIMKTRDPMIAEKQLDYFNNDLIGGLKAKGAASARRIGKAETVLKALSSDVTVKSAEDWAKAGRSSVAVGDVLTKAGFQPGGPGWEQVAKGLGLEAVTDLKGKHVPEDVAADLMRMGEAWKTPAALQPVAQAWGMAMNMFKTGVTAVFPAFHARNVASGLFNMWRDNAFSPTAMSEARTVQLGGYLSEATAAKAYPGMSVADATSAFKKDLLEHNTAYTRSGIGKDVVGSDAALQGYTIPTTTGTARSKKEVLGDFFKGFAPLPPEQADGFSKTRQLLDPTLSEGVGANKNVNRFINRGREVGEAAEDWMRSSHFLAKKLQGFASDVANDAVTKYHIDYGDMTSTEKLIKNFVPWYSFSRKSLPPLLEDLVTKPAKLTGATRAVAGTRNENQWAPSYIAEGASFPMFGAPEGHNRYISSFGLPMEDEAFKILGHAAHGNLRRATESALGMISPFLKMIPEQATDTQLFSGRRLSDLEPSATVSLGGLLPHRFAQGATQVIANTPAARVVSTLDRAMDTRKWDGSGLANAITGLRVSDVNLDRAKPAAEREFLVGALRPAKETKIRESLYIPEQYRGTLSPADQQLLDALMMVDKQTAAKARERAKAAK